MCSVLSNLDSSRYESSVSGFISSVESGVGLADGLGEFSWQAELAINKNRKSTIIKSGFFFKFKPFLQLHTNGQ
jgi:hypothetical protein